MPLIPKNQAVKLLQPYLAESLDVLIKQRDKHTGRVHVPVGELTVVQSGVAGVKEHRGRALKFHDWEVEALLKLLQAREEAQRQQSERQRMTPNPKALLAAAEQARQRGYLKTARAMERIARAQMPPV